MGESPIGLPPYFDAIIPESTPSSTGDGVRVRVEGPTRSNGTGRSVIQQSLEIGESTDFGANFEVIQFRWRHTFLEVHLGL
jgi:hypothetical protein